MVPALALGDLHVPHSAAFLPARFNSRLLPGKIQRFLGTGNSLNKLKVFMCLESNGTRNRALEVEYSDKSDRRTEEPFPTINSEPVADSVLSESVNGPVEQRRGAKIHDFCFGIPFGGVLFGGGIVGFLFSRNVSILSTGVLFGGAILALSSCSLKVWREGKSSLPFILGQAALAGVLAVNNFQAYSLTKKFFPSGFYAVFSAAMLCFYSYVMKSGGNPPSKKLRAAT